jgi:hypothetical protein
MAKPLEPARVDIMGFYQNLQGCCASEAQAAGRSQSQHGSSFFLSLKFREITPGGEQLPRARPARRAERDSFSLAGAGPARVVLWQVSADQFEQFDGVQAPLGGAVGRDAGNFVHWTRKIDNKTKTQALTNEQAKIVQQAIDRNRQLELSLNRLRSLSEQIIWDITPCFATRKRTK